MQFSREAIGAAWDLAAGFRHEWAITLTRDEAIEIYEGHGRLGLKHMVVSRRPEWAKGGVSVPEIGYLGTLTHTTHTKRVSVDITVEGDAHVFINDSRGVCVAGAVVHPDGEYEVTYSPGYGNWLSIEGQGLLESLEQVLRYLMGPTPEGKPWHQVVLEQERKDDDDAFAALLVELEKPALYRWSY
jgi:hypothetical protein